MPGANPKIVGHNPSAIKNVQYILEINLRPKVLPLNIIFYFQWVNEQSSLATYSTIAGLQTLQTIQQLIKTKSFTKSFVKQCGPPQL
jgi:hypothetical protein